jgi:hypothetical protein
MIEGGGVLTFEGYPPLLKSTRVAMMQRSCRHDACAHTESILDVHLVIMGKRLSIDLIFLC